MGILDALLTYPPSGSSSSLLTWGTLPTAPTQRKVYFAFDFDDVMRVNNVRRAWKHYRPDSPLSPGFYDSSLWESRKLDGDEALKALMRSGVQNTSTVCVLVGSDTYKSRWVRYEIARAVIDGRGLLAVHINGLNHHVRQLPDIRGTNPLHFIGIGQPAPGVFYLYERRWRTLNWLSLQGQWEWHRYEDYTWQVDRPSYLPSPSVGYVMRLSAGTKEYDYMPSGFSNIGRWIDEAARRVGR